MLQVKSECERCLSHYRQVRVAVVEHIDADLDEFQN